MKTSEQVKKFVETQFQSRKEVIKLSELIRKLNAGEYVSKGETLETLISFVHMNDQLVNSFAEIICKVEVTNEMLRKTNQHLEDILHGKLTISDIIEP